MDFLWAPLVREEMGPRSSFLLRTLCRAQSTALDTRKCCHLASLI